MRMLAVAVGVAFCGGGCGETLVSATHTFAGAAQRESADLRYVGPMFEAACRGYARVDYLISLDTAPDSATRFQQFYASAGAYDVQCKQFAEVGRLFVDRVAVIQAYEVALESAAAADTKQQANVSKAAKSTMSILDASVKIMALDLTGPVATAAGYLAQWVLEGWKEAELEKRVGAAEANYRAAVLGLRKVVALLRDFVRTAPLATLDARLAVAAKSHPGPAVVAEMELRDGAKAELDRIDAQLAAAEDMLCHLAAAHHELSQGWSKTAGEDATLRSMTAYVQTVDADLRAMREAAR